ncbi:MAG: hypothetical protein E6Q60_08375 [Nitrosomonas oligotropha]|uniref:RiboL-PSP-HEPN domain-containing protein n=1 Tax=Nitrosomonas oligotropha TaxID=42354 RepID=A0A5C7VQI3_9PROT|nr:MAG: hypothetical protein E6Q60_08375 [Nitrosomonas oligotropha]
MSRSSTDRILPQRAIALKEVFDAKPDLTSESDSDLAAFLSAYFLCEVLANKLIEYFETDNPPANVKSKIEHSETDNPPTNVKSKKKKSQFKTLDVRKIKRALTHFSLDFPCDDTDTVFKSGKSKVGKHTARQLRNEYIHSLSLSARKEIAERTPELLGLMSRFCTVVKTRISKQGL